MYPHGIFGDSEPDTFSVKMVNSAILLFDSLVDVTATCQAEMKSLTEEQAAQGLAFADKMRARFKQWRWERWELQAGTLLQILPPELLSRFLSQLDRRDLARFAATCCLLWFDAPTAPARQIGPVETELRLRAEACNYGSSLPEGATSWVPYLLKCERRYARSRHAPLAAGLLHSVFVDTDGRLLTCGAGTLGHAQPGAGGDRIGPPTLVPSMLDRRIVSVASSVFHCLALGAGGEVYSWGDGRGGVLGHGDENTMVMPSKIESLERIESIMAGDNISAAVDERGRLFTWGLRDIGLGYAPDPQTASQLTPKMVDALSQDRVVGVALGGTFALAVTNDGAVFSFGNGWYGALGHGSLESEVLPRRIEALTQTGRRFVAVAAGDCHALALTEGGHLYGWGWGGADGFGKFSNVDRHTPELLTALLGERVTLMHAKALSSCAVTETGELYTWGDRNRHGHLGHSGVVEEQTVPRRVEMLGGVRVASVALGMVHMLVADEDGGVWACGERRALGLGNPDVWRLDGVREPTLISTLRIRIP